MAATAPRRAPSASPRGGGTKPPSRSGMATQGGFSPTARRAAAPSATSSPRRAWRPAPSRPPTRPRPRGGGLRRAPSSSAGRRRPRGAGMRPCPSRGPRPSATCAGGASRRPWARRCASTPSAGTAPQPGGCPRWWPGWKGPTPSRSIAPTWPRTAPAKPRWSPRRRCSGLPPAASCADSIDCGRPFHVHRGRGFRRIVGGRSGMMGGRCGRRVQGFRSRGWGRAFCVRR